MKAKVPLALVALAAVTCAPAPRPPNVLLIVVDTLRADRVGADGFPRGTTPHLDALARRGTSFSRAYASASWTLPSIASILTGLHSTTLATTRFRSRIPEAVPTLAERLRAEGYATAAVVSHILVAARLGFDRGFEEFDQSEAGGTRHLPSPGVTARGERRLREFAARGKPFFLFLHYFDPHYAFMRREPYIYSSESTGRITGNERHRALTEMTPLPTREEIGFLLDRYDEEVRATDAAIGRILRTLAELGLSDETLVVVTADHGEEFWDHGRFGHGGTQSLHEEVVRVPLVLRRSKTSPGIVSEPVSLVSITPTILAELGLPSDARSQAPPLPPPVATEARANEAALCEFVFTGREFVRDSDRGVVRTLVGARYKLIEDETAGSVAVFDLIEDPAERTDLARSNPSLAADLSERLARRVEGLQAAAYPPESVDLTEPDRERLRALGYFGD